MCPKPNQRSSSTLNPPSCLCFYLNRKHQHPPSCPARHPRVTLVLPFPHLCTRLPTFNPFLSCERIRIRVPMPHVSMSLRSIHCYGLGFHSLTRHQYRASKLSPLPQYLRPPIISLPVHTKETFKNTNLRTFFLKSFRDSYHPQHGQCLRVAYNILG